MKTLITANATIIRRKDDEARAMVRGDAPFVKGDYEFCSKSEWKKVRPTPKGQGKNEKPAE